MAVARAILLRTSCVCCAVAAASACSANEELAAPGPVALHRLNRSEYDRTVRDLFGTPLSPARDFPTDDTSYGFDNISDVLALSPLLFELYDEAAKKLVAELTGRPPLARIDGKNLRGPNGSVWKDRGWRLSEGEVGLEYRATAPGIHRVNLFIEPMNADREPPVVEIRAGSELLLEERIEAPKRVELSLTVSSTVAPVQLILAIKNPPREPGKARSVLISWVRFEGPLDGISPAPLFTCRPTRDAELEPCARKILEPLLRRAYRRPPAPEELDRKIAVAVSAWNEGERFEDAIGLALEAMLISPYFIFRVEPAAEEKGVCLDDHALAARLSYFLWSSMPDDALARLADEGRLQEDATLTAEVARMLADPKSDALVKNFGAQWLQARDIAGATPNTVLFPEAGEALKISLHTELELFFEALLREDRPVEDLLRADFTFVDRTLAAHYGMTEPGEDEFHRVTLGAGDPRRGYLGKGAFHVISSHSDRTSIPRRGKWVLGNLLCSAPPPPPPLVPQLPDAMDNEGTLRERIEAHRDQPACAGCHAVMDPIGFGLENFDAIGRWRELDEGRPIDASGELPGGLSFNGPSELSELIASRPGLRRCFAEKIYIYGLGRAPAPENNPELEAITARYSADGGSFSDLIRALVLSESFRSRKVSR